MDIRLSYSENISGELCIFSNIKLFKVFCFFFGGVWGVVLTLAAFQTSNSGK